MGKNRNEVNGVLVYRRWCAGAIFSILTLILIIAAPVAAFVYNWLVIQVPDTSVASEVANYNVAGLDLLKFILNKNFVIQTLIDDIGGATTVRFFPLIMKYSLYGMFGFLALLVFFGAIELIFFIFYVFTGRVIDPAGPVRVSWVLFALHLIYAGLSFGLSYFISHAYAAAQGVNVNFVQYILPAIMPRLVGDGFVVNFFWPLVYLAASFISAFLLTIIYFISFRDKFYIGRAKRFGSGESDNNRYGGTTNIITSGGTTTAPNNGQPQVIVVNSSPLPNGQGPAVITTGPGVPPQQINVVNQPANGSQEQVEALPKATLPKNLVSIGGHAYSKNLDLKYADIPDGIKELGVAAFANCLNLEIVSIPKSVRRIKKNCFFNCGKLVRINYAGTKADWRYVARGSNWLDKAGTNTVVCSDGAIIVDPHR